MSSIQHKSKHVTFAGEPVPIKKGELNVKEMNKAATEALRRRGILPNKFNARRQR